jgi:hypothetical protein
MKFAKLMLAFGTLALAVASAASTYHVTISDPQWVGGTQLKPGDYKVQVEGDKATFKAGKTMVAVPVKVETNDKKFSDTSLRTQDVNGKSTIQEIRIGGSNTKLVVATTETGAAAAQ